MLIVCTQDDEVRSWARNAKSGASQWGKLAEIPKGSQANADTKMAEAIAALDKSEALCFSAHGNDEEIGDEDLGGWGWKARAIAALLKSKAPAGYKGPILISACAKNVSNFSALLVVKLEEIKALNGVWVYGYNKAVDSTVPFPDPSKMDKMRDLQGTQVKYSEELAPA